MTEIVMYIVVNKNLNMSKGKVAAQVAHAAVKASHDASHSEAFSIEWEIWYKKSYPKIVVKASEFEIRKLMKYSFCRWIFDEGRTQIKKGSLTALALFPMVKDFVPDEIKEMKLL